MNIYGFFPIHGVSDESEVQHMAETIAERAQKLALPIVQEAGLELWDVEFVKEGPTHYLRVYLDKAEETVDLEDCEKVSRALDKLLDKYDFISHSYCLEVCSAGLERTLKRDSDFERYIGSPVRIKLFAPRGGAKEYVGNLKSYEDGKVVLEDGEVFEKGKFSSVQLYVEF